MSEPQISDPVGQPNDQATGPGEMLEDTLLGSESPEHKSTPDLGLVQSVAVATDPISMEAATRSITRRRNLEEMSKRPSWLPEVWKIKLRVRSSGATAGHIDRYFIGPSGHPRLRSKTELLCFLETGSKKRKATSEDGTQPSESPSGLHKKSNKKGKKSDDVPKSPITSLNKSRNKNKKPKNPSDNVPKIWMSRNVLVWDERDLDLMGS